MNHAGKILYTGTTWYSSQAPASSLFKDSHSLPTDFLAAALEAKGNIAKHKIAEAFAELDEDSDGYITKVSGDVQ